MNNDQRKSRTKSLLFIVDSDGSRKSVLKKNFGGTKKSNQSGNLNSRKDVHNEDGEETRAECPVAADSAEGAEGDNVSHRETDNVGAHAKRDAAGSREERGAGSTESNDRYTSSRSRIEETVAPGTSFRRVSSTCELQMARDLNRVVFEGETFVRRRIMRCFWNRKYAIITSDGRVKLFRELDGKGKVAVNLKDVEVMSRKSACGYKHPFRIVFGWGSGDLTIGFDREDVRDAWTAHLTNSMGSAKQR